MEQPQPLPPEFNEDTIGLEKPDAEYPFRKSAGTYIVLTFLIILFPGFNILVAFLTDNQIDFDLFDPVLFFFLPTIIMLWLFVLAVLLALWREKATLPSIGLNRLRWIHLVYGLAFILVSNMVLLLLQFVLNAIGITFNNNIELIIEIAIQHIWWWLAISISAAVCEEISFRGYLMSRIKWLTGWGWAVPVVISTFAFATGHLYQGWGGFITILVYGAMFAILYVLTKSIWPGIIAHFIQDFSAVYIYKIFGP